MSQRYSEVEVGKVYTLRYHVDNPVAKRRRHLGESARVPMSHSYRVDSLRPFTVSVLYSPDGDLSTKELSHQRKLYGAEADLYRSPRIICDEVDPIVVNAEVSVGLEVFLYRELPRQERFVDEYIKGRYFNRNRFVSTVLESGAPGVYCRFDITNPYLERGIKNFALFVVWGSYDSALRELRKYGCRI